MSRARTEGVDSENALFSFTTLIKSHPEIIFQIVEQADTTRANVGAHIVLLTKLRSTCKYANGWGSDVLSNKTLGSPPWLLRYNEMILDATKNNNRPLNIVMRHQPLMLKAYAMLKNMYTCEWVFGIVLHFIKTRCELVFEEVDARFAFLGEDSFEFVSYIYAGMRCHKSHSQIQLDGLDILAQLVTVSIDQSIMAIQGLVLTCADTVNAHTNDGEIVKAALELLASVLSRTGTDCEKKLTACSLATFNSISSSISNMIVVFMKEDLVVAPGTRSDVKERFFVTLSTASSLLTYFWRYGTSEYLRGHACQQSVRRVGRLLYRYRYTAKFNDFFNNVVHVYRRLQDTTQPVHTSMLHLLQTSKILRCCMQAVVESIDDELNYTAVFLISCMAKIGYTRIHGRPIGNLVALAISKAANRLQMDMYSDLFVYYQMDLATAMNTLLVQGVAGEFHSRQTGYTDKGVCTLIVSLLSRYASEVNQDAMVWGYEDIIWAWIVLLSTILKDNAKEQNIFIAMGGIQLCLKFFHDNKNRASLAAAHQQLSVLMCTLVTTHYNIIGRGRILNVTNQVASAVIYTLEEMSQITVCQGDCAISLLTHLITDKQLSYENSLQSIAVVERMLREMDTSAPSNQAGALQYKILNFLVLFVENDPTYSHFQRELYAGFVFPSHNTVVLREDYKLMLATVKSHMHL